MIVGNGILTNRPGNITLSFRKNKKKNVCTWFIKVPKYHRVYIHFVSYTLKLFDKKRNHKNLSIYSTVIDVFNDNKVLRDTIYRLYRYFNWMKFNYLD